MRLPVLLVLLGLTPLLNACATASRGTSTNLLVVTDPVGARVQTTLPRKTIEPRTSVLSNADIQPLPDNQYRYCEPTPCGVEVPRKSEFSILVTKEGYNPVMVDIGHKTRKEIEQLTAKRTKQAAAGGVVAGAAGGILAAEFGASLMSIGGPTVAAPVAGPALAGAAITVIPIIGLGMISAGVDNATGANLDLWPNPVNLQLVPLGETPDQELNRDVINAFQNMKVEDVKERARQEEARRNYNYEDWIKQHKAKREAQREAFWARQKSRFETPATNTDSPETPDTGSGPDK